MSERRPATFVGAEGNRLAADLWGSGNGPVAVLLHGGGQTRHSWGATAARLAEADWRAVTVDQRGHGDSDWVDSGRYSFPDFAADAACVFAQVGDQTGWRPVAIGASLGGLAALMVAGGRTGPAPSALVLVDVTPRMDRSGIAGVRGFMAAHSDTGFASVAEAADAIAAYLPRRPRPPSPEGLRKNLRTGADGRFYWHWDPRLLSGPVPIASDEDSRERTFAEAARRVSIPTLLVRGARSELVGQEHVRDFLELVPHAAFADVGGAGHMLAGDRNDAFAGSVIDFLAALDTGGEGFRVPGESVAAGS